MQKPRRRVILVCQYDASSLFPSAVKQREQLTDFKKREQPSDLKAA